MNKHYCRTKPAGINLVEIVLITLSYSEKRRLDEDSEVERHEVEETISSSPVKARRSSVGRYNSQTLCFFCDDYDSSSNLHCASTLNVDKKVRDCAVLLNDRKRIAKLSAGDLIAIEAKYHVKCFVRLYNRARPFKQHDSKPADDTPMDVEELAFAELIVYIDKCLEVEEPAILLLSDLVSYYTSKLQELVVEYGKVNATWLEERVLAPFPDLTAHVEGREIQLVSQHEIGGMPSKVKKMDSDAVYLARAAHIVRREILKIKKLLQRHIFTRMSGKCCSCLLAITLVGMIIKGPTTKAEPSESQACLSIVQLIVINSISRPRNRPEATGSTHHIRSRECPLPIYTALKIHGATRDRSLIGTFYNLGMCISYDRFLSMSSEITNSVIERYVHERVVYPFKLRETLFTTAAVDNIDHNLSSTTSQGWFHGTAVPLVQHPSNGELGSLRDIDVFDPNKSPITKTISHLPSSYSEATPMAVPGGDLNAPEVPKK